MRLRTPIFWIHLAAGTLAGLIVLVMSVTGILLAYERQILAWAAPSPHAPPSGSPFSPEQLLGRLAEQERADPATLTLYAQLGRPAEAAFGRDRMLYLDPSNGQVLGEGPRRLRAFFRAVEDWHRWLALEGAARPIGRAVTGACNFIFLLLLLSGAFLWFPKHWTWTRVRGALWFKPGLAGRARDWNWHNTAGIWSVAPLVLIVVSGVVMSYPWANNLLYRLAGNEPPVAQGREAPRAGGRSEGRANYAGLNALWMRAEQQVPGWRSINLRLPRGPRAPMVFAIDTGNGGRPDLRSQLTLDARSGEVIRWEPFESYNRGRRLRAWLRFAHTGEAGGVAGQTIALLASFAAVLLVLTGLSLAIRRFGRWLTKRKASSIESFEIQRKEKTLA